MVTRVGPKPIILGETAMVRLSGTTRPMHATDLNEVWPSPHYSPDRPARTLDNSSSDAIAFAGESAAPPHDASTLCVAGRWKLGLHPRVR